MKHFARVLVAASLAASLAGCEQFKQFVDTIPSALSTVGSTTVPIEAVVTAVSGFNSVVIVATAYTNQRRCNGSNGPLCRDPALRKTISDAITTGIDAREKLEAFMRAHPGELGAAGVYDALILATQTLTNATAKYRAAKPTT